MISKTKSQKLTKKANLMATKIGLQVRAENLANKKKQLQKKLDETHEHESEIRESIIKLRKESHKALTTAEIIQIKNKVQELMRILGMDGRSETTLTFLNRELEITSITKARLLAELECITQEIKLTEDRI